MVNSYAVGHAVVTLGTLESSNDQPGILAMRCFNKPRPAAAADDK